MYSSRIDARDAPLRGVLLAVGLFALAIAGGLSGCRLLGSTPQSAAPAAFGRPKVGSLAEAAQRGDLESVQAAVKANPALVTAEDETGWSAAAYAAWNAHKEVYDYLVSQGAATSVFTEAALGPLQALVERLRTNPVAMDARDGHHKAPPLVWAVRTGNRAGVEFLLDMGADVDLPDRSGRTALHAAVSAGDLEIGRVLIQAGANPEAADREGRTALHLAAESGQLQFCVMLLETGAASDLKDAEGNTPLHLAAARGDFELCEYLLFLGAPAGLRNAQGLTPGELAAREGHGDVAALLQGRP